MKKLLWLVAVIAFSLGIGTLASANCLTVNFDNGDSICLQLEKSWSRYYASVSNAPSNATLKCDVVLPNSVNESLGACDGYFSYSASSTQSLRLYVWLNNREFKVIDANYNFSNGTWGSSSDAGGGGSSNSNLSVSTNRSSPSTNEWVNLTVRTNASYRDYVYFSLQYLDGYTWRTASSSDYGVDNYFNRGYQMTSSDYGERTFNSFIRFYRNAQYRLYVEDRNGNRNYVEFTVGGGGGSTSNLSISTNKSSPNTNEWVNATVKADSSYRGKVAFYVQYRSSTSYSWSTVSSSSYFSADSYLTNGYWFSSSDYGSRTFSDFISFKETGYYRLYARDDSGRESYVEFTVGGSYSNNITVATNRSSPSTNEYVNVTVKTNSSYTDYVYFSLEYYDGYTRRTASSSDYSVDNYFNNGYKFSYSDYGERTFTSFIRFYRNAQYRLYVRDYSGNRSYVEFNVGGGGGSTSTLSLSTNKSSPNTNERVNATVKADSSYRGKVTFYVQYRSSTSYSWSTVSSSSYFSADSYLTNGYWFSSSDYGSRTFSDFISFKETGYYRLYARDDSGRESYVEFTVGGSYSNTFSVSTNRSSPSTNEYVNVTVKTNSSYTDYVYFSLEYYDGYSRRTASSSDYSVDNYFNNGYRFTYSDYGQRTFSSFIKFYRTGRYRLYVRDYNSGNRNYVEFNVGGTSSSDNTPSNVNGFTVGELNKLTEIYNLRNSLIAQLQRQSRNLRNDSYWLRLSNTFYQNMQDVVNNRSNKEFYNRSRFLSAFLTRLDYTNKNA